MKILFTGASGFIGRNFLEFAPRDIEIIGIYNSSKDIKDFVKNKNLKNVKLYKCDLTKEDETKELFQKIGKKFDYCLYLASNVNVPLSKENPKRDAELTVFTFLNFMQSLDNINRLVYLSTAGVYDGNKGIVTTETKLNPKVPYCISKAIAEQYVKFFHSIGKINEYVIIRFGGAFGLYSEKKFMTKLVKDISIENKNEMEVYGDGTNIINVMYVKDAIKALIAALSAKKSNLTANLGQENMTITETVKKAAKALNKKVKIKYTPRLEKQKYIDFKIKVDFNETFNFNPDYSFEEGIKEFAKALKNEK